MDYSILYGPTYEILGVPTTIALLRGDTILVTAIDKTSGVAVDHLETVLPAAAVRYGELVEKGVEAKELVGAIVMMNDVAWECNNYKMRPSPAGELAGEVYLLLRKQPARRES